LSANYGDKLILSSFSHAFGTLVEFLCADDTETLKGASVLQCLGTGVWNGTVPECITKAGKLEAWRQGLMYTNMHNSE